MECTYVQYICTFAQLFPLWRAVWYLIWNGNRPYIQIECILCHILYIPSHPYEPERLLTIHTWKHVYVLLCSSECGSRRHNASDEEFARWKYLHLHILPRTASACARKRGRDDDGIYWYFNSNPHSLKKKEKKKAGKQTERTQEHKYTNNLHAEKQHKWMHWLSGGYYRTAKPAGSNQKSAKGTRVSTGRLRQGRDHW